MSALSRMVLASLALAGLCAAPAMGAGAAQVRPRQLVTQYTCGQVKGIEADLKRASELSADAREEVQILGAKCAAEEHNRNRPETPPQVVVVTPDQSALATSNKIFFATISVGDSQAVRDYCSKVAAGGPTVATEAGPVACEGFVRAAKANNPLIILAPSSIEGSATTTHILALIGAEEAERQVQAETNRVSAVVQRSSVTGAQAVIDNPVILVASTSQGSQLGGTRGQFFHATKCLGTMGFGSNC